MHCIMFWDNRSVTEIIPNHALMPHFIVISKLSGAFRKVLHYTILRTDHCKFQRTPGENEVTYGFLAKRPGKEIIR